MANKEKENDPINPPILEFIDTLEKNLSEEQKKEKTNELDEDEEIEETGDSMARMYERVRNLIEYKDDHLVKRYAIERMLKRNLIIELRQQDFSIQFLNEFVMAGYIERPKIFSDLKEQIQKTISKYQKAVRLASGYEAKKWLVSIASCEIEEILFPSPARYALARAMFETMKPRLNFSRRLPAREKDIQVFLAVLKSLSKVDNIYLSYYLAKVYLPEWFDKKSSENQRLRSVPQLTRLSRQLRRELQNPLSPKIGAAIRKYSVYFNVLYGAALANLAKIQKVFQNPESLKFAVQLSAEEAYDREMRKFWKRVKRSLAFLVITKVILAIVVEYPYDLYIAKNVNFLPLVINLVFPPLYLLALSTTVRRPSAENSSLIARGVSEIVYSREEKPISEIRLEESRTFSDWALNLFFILTFGISFGLAIWILRILHFNLLGIVIFLFLFSVVSFFNALVRQPVRTFLIAREKEGFIGVIIDTLSIPFVRIGKWMSINFSRVNVFIFLFDVIIEAPFKVFIRFIQEWSGFIRRKKEEIV